MIRFVKDGMMDEAPVDALVIYVHGLDGRADHGYTINGVHYPFAPEE